MPVWGKPEFDTFYGKNVERWGVPNTRPSIKLGYHWFWTIAAQSGQNVAGLQSPNFPQLLVQVLGLVPGDAVLLFGCGFNGTGAGLTALGINVIGVDTSSYIDSQKGQTEEAEIRAACLAAGVNPDTDTIWGPPGNVRVNPLDLFLQGGRASPQPRGKGSILAEGMTSRPSRNTVKNALAANPRYVITEEVLNSITDSEALVVCDACQRFVTENGNGTVVHMLSPFQSGASQAPSLNWKTYGAWRTFLTANAFPLQRILPTVDGTGQGVAMPLTNPIGVVTAYSGLI